MDVPWFARPAQILGRLYPEVTIRKVERRLLPPYLPRGTFFTSAI
jgi:hypothetical protein